MKKKGNLSEALLGASKGSATKNAPASAHTQSTPAPAPPGREGKKAIAGFFDPAVSRQLKEIGLERGGLSVQEMLREALNDFFAKHGRSAIA